jgi:hypothetical protein
LCEELMMSMLADVLTLFALVALLGLWCVWSR